FDLLCFWAIRKLHVPFKYAVVFYFCSPIILYGTFMHGQLDIIPTSLLVTAVYYLLNWKQKKHLLIYAILLGLSLSCKAHIWAAVPILFFYIAKKKDYMFAIKTHMVSLLVVCCFTVGFWGEGFISTVIMNTEQSILTSVGFDYGSVQLLIPIAVLAIVYLNAFELNYFNKNLLISMLGMLFTLFLICISPMPAWFIWIVPFYALYFGFVREDKYKLMLMYAAFNAIYVFYFLALHQTEYTDLYFLGRSLQWMKINDASLRSMVFTVMVACLGAIVYKIYRFGIASNNLYRRRSESFAIGIAGDSGAGKSKLLEKIERLFGSGKDILFIEGDGDHRWARNDENWEQFTALDPQANFLYRQAEDIKRLKRGNHVLRSEYDHDSGTFTAKKRVDTKKYIVLCGLHSLYLPSLRDELDLKIFMDTDNKLRNYWKIQRDTSKRGYSKEKIVEQINKRMPDAEKYIYPQKQYADLIITYFDKTLSDCYVDNHTVELSVKFEVSINMDLEGLLKSFEAYGVHPEHWICDDFYRQGIIFDGKEIMNNIDFEKIAEENIPQYEDFFTYYPQWGKDVEGVIQIMLLYLISEKMKG
ncbi:MAG: uridine kinase, partial [Clostridiales bacterium]|nr:uridine kinase [Clostridiales bacterium]